MTWAFAYVTVLVVGLVLAAVTGLLRDLRSLARHRLVVPHADQKAFFVALLGRGLSIGLILVGGVGFVLTVRRVPDQWSTMGVALGAGLLGFLLAHALLRRTQAPGVSAEKAVVLREIAPGGYGQVRIEHGEKTVIMAAESVDSGVIPVGTVVEVVDSSHSVLKIRRLPVA